MATLFIMVGCPGSGKSTWAMNHLEDLQAHYVSRDAIRYAHLKDDENYFAHEKETFEIFIEEIVSNLKAGDNVIADASHLNRASRKKLLNAIDCADDTLEYETICVCMRTSLRDSLSRNAKRSGRACVPESVVVDMYEHMTKPEWGEHPSIKEVWLIETPNRE